MKQYHPFFKKMIMVIQFFKNTYGHLYLFIYFLSFPSFFSSNSLVIFFIFSLLVC